MHQIVTTKNIKKFKITKKNNGTFLERSGKLIKNVSIYKIK